MKLPLPADQFTPSLFHRLQQLGPAAAHYTEALRLAPTFVECHTNLGHVLRDSGDLPVCVSP